MALYKGLSEWFGMEMSGPAEASDYSQGYPRNPDPQAQSPKGAMPTTISDPALRRLRLSYPPAKVG